MKQKREKNILLRLIADSRRHWLGLIWLTAMMAMSGLFKSYAADYFGVMVDMGTRGQFDRVLFYGGVVIAMYGADAVRLALFNVETVRVVDSMFLDIKTRMFNAIAHAQMPTIDRAIQAGDVLSRVTGDLTSLNRLFAEQFTWLISVFFRGIIALAFCIGLSWKLSFIYVILLPALIYIMNRIAKPIQAMRKNAARSDGRAYTIISEVMHNNPVVKAFGAEAEMETRFARAINEKLEKLKAGEKRGMTLTLISYLADVLQMALVFVLGGFFIARGEMTVGALVSFVTLTASIREAFGLANALIVAIREANAVGARVYEILDLPPESGSTAIDKGQGEPYVNMRNLSFSYAKDTPVLSGINMRIEKGQRIGFVGPSGCGKSTLVKLICKFYTEYEGELTLFGQPAEPLTPASLRGRIALVSQDAYLFQGSIAENVRFGRLGAADLEVEQALRAVQLWDFVSGLEHGIHTPIGDFGSRLSGGQKQRLAIARALIRDADLVILDEATSALDVETEAEIQKTLETLFVDKTVIVVAHRFAALRGVDYVYCLDGGNIIEQGPMTQLMESDGYLRRIAAAQGAFKGDGDG